MGVGAYLHLLTFLYFNPRSLTTIQDAKRMSIKIHFKGVVLHTYKFTNANVHT